MDNNVQNVPIMGLGMKHSLSPRELAEAIGVSESSLKRWVDEGRLEVTRTEGGHRRIALSEAVRYIRRSGSRIVNPVALGLADVTNLPPNQLERPESADQPLVDAIVGGQAALARGLVAAMYIGGRSVSEICDGPIARAMHFVGDLWKHSEKGILIEHRATDTSAQSLNLLRSLIKPAASDAPLATGCTPAGDPYILTSMMASVTLCAEGWREENLGADVPLDLMAAAAREREASLVWVSVCMEQSSQKLAGQLLTLATDLQSISCPLAVGGRMLPPRPMLVGDNLHVISNMSELAAFARGLQTANSASTV